MSSKFNIFTVVVPSELQWKSTIPGDGKQADHSYSSYCSMVEYQDNEPDSHQGSTTEPACLNCGAII